MNTPRITARLFHSVRFYRPLNAAHGTLSPPGITACNFTAAMEVSPANRQILLAMNGKI
jgi:hypothetical protein